MIGKTLAIYQYDVIWSMIVHEPGGELWLMLSSGGEDPSRGSRSVLAADQFDTMPFVVPK